MAVMERIGPVTRADVKNGARSLFEGELPGRKRQRLDGPGGLSPRSLHTTDGATPADGRRAAVQPPRVDLGRLEEAKVVSVQAVVRGYMARKQVRVKTLCDGVIHVKIRGNSDLLARLGIEGIHTPDPKVIDFVAIDPNKYTAQLAGDGKVFSARANSGLAIVRTLLRDKPEANAPCHVVLNAMFYNVMLSASMEYDGAATIGEAVIPKVDLPKHIPVHAGYEDHFVSHEFHDGSKLTTGPLLCADDEVKFDARLLEDRRFQWDPEGFQPGMLRHANHPNARAGVVLPGESDVREKLSPSPAAQDRIRAFAVVSNNGTVGPTANGLDMPETANLALRLSRMNKRLGGKGLNFDGGQSTQLVVLKKSLGPWRAKVLEVTQSPLATASNYVVFSRKPTTDRQKQDQDDAST